MSGLRTTATEDLKTILEDSTTGFGWPLILTDPDGNSATLTGNTGDISLLIDPDTGQAVSGRLAHVGIAIASLGVAGLSMPKAVADPDSKPWTVVFTDTEAGLNSYTFKVSSSDPDRTIGIVTCTLEVYEP